MPVLASSSGHQTDTPDEDDASSHPLNRKALSKHDSRIRADDKADIEDGSGEGVAIADEIQVSLESEEGLSSEVSTWNSSGK